MAYVEKHYAKPGACCGHSYRRHGTGTPRCTTPGCGCKGWRAAAGDKLRYRCRWRDPAGDERSKTFGRRIDADRHAISVEDTKLRGVYVDPKGGRTLFGDQAERWYRTKAALRPSTLYDYRHLLDLEIFPTFKETPLAAIDPLVIEEWLAELIAGGVSAKRAGKARSVVYGVLASAVKAGLLPRNVAAEVAKPKVQRAEMRFLDAAQVELVAAEISTYFARPGACCGHRHHRHQDLPPRCTVRGCRCEGWQGQPKDGHARAAYGTLVRVAAYSGLRPSELVALRIGRVDLRRGTIRVAEAAPEVNGHLAWGGVKTHEARTVKVPASIVAELRDLIGDRRLDVDALVFTSRDGHAIRFSKWAVKYFKPALVAVGLPDMRVYDLRHTCASLLIREGASIKAVQKHMGHATAAMTLDVYGHLFPDELDQLAERLETVRAEAVAAAKREAKRTGCVPDVVALRGGAGQ